MHLLPLYAFRAWTATTLPLLHNIKMKQPGERELLFLVALPQGSSRSLL